MNFISIIFLALLGKSADIKLMQTVVCQAFWKFSDRCYLPSQCTMDGNDPDQQVSSTDLPLVPLVVMVT